MKHANKQLLAIFGTRPEAIKMAPIIKAFNDRGSKIQVCITAQHREMLDSVLDVFDIKPDIDLNLMRADQSLSEITASIITNLKNVLLDVKPSRVLVHGDTTTSFAAALSSFYARIPVAHVEAGLRTGNPYSPWPEEMNRVLTSRIADLHFAPTHLAQRNLENEGINRNKIVVTGNTVIDALFSARSRLAEDQKTRDKLDRQLGLDKSRRLILVTCHRRENLGSKLENICHAINAILHQHQNIQVLFPVHLNPQVRKPVTDILGRASDSSRLKLLEPLDYLAFTHLLIQADIIITDSGGLQEEASSLGKPTLVLRESTERPEALETGTTILVGTSIEAITREAKSLLTDDHRYRLMSKPSTIFGDGKASQRIKDVLLSSTSLHFS